MSNAIVHIVDDDPDLRELLSRLVNSVELETRTYASGDEFLDTVDPKGAGCLLLDVRMPRMSGLELHNRVKKLNIKWPVIFITGHGDVSMAVRSMRDDAFDFIEKPFHNQFLVDRVQEAVAYSEAKYKADCENSSKVDALNKLTSRERQVLDLVVKGETNKVIAYTLSISIKTVEVHRSNAMQKLNAHSLAQLIEIYQNLNIS